MSNEWRIGGGRVLRWERGRPLVMAVINTTPDSFSDGGAHISPESACAFALECIAEGAAIVDVGGESTRPGAASVGEQEQIARTIPVISAILARASDAVISVDTTRAAVARAALDAGASIINDVSAGEDDPAMFALAAERECGLVLMHRVRRPADDSYSDRYSSAPIAGDIVEVARVGLLARTRAAVEAGVDPAAIAIDPGLGFGKSVEQNFELMARIEEIVALGHPVLVGASRKSFIGAAIGEPDPTRRDAESALLAAVMAPSGIAVVRAHDVRSHVRALAVVAMLLHRSHC